ncbi:MAG: Type II restriction enzyme methylase subunit [Candidatus Methanohalarchaeum thermophilum]|uniref:site-specific DNA-methyltransferase (adenine-specific) n=1 Tax=Methanohalarchaeum thermophilum TaxID=1903181 RepID=A0A1Q6DVB6_METT1|nr:MAG: Type II restriction enzyme methylase subunit [Candidatus Methanohalarchaeum thermophilum]
MLSVSPQKTLSKFNNQNLFSDHYLDELIQERPEWDVSEEEIKEVQESLKEKYEYKNNQFSGYTEGNLETEWIRPVLDELGHSYGTQQTDRSGQQPDYAFFESKDVKYSLDPGGDEYYEEAVAVGDAKSWKKSLDKKTEEGNTFNKTNPSYQIDYYMSKTDTDWGLLTNGKKWRLYYTKGRLDRYYEVDLINLLYEEPEKFKYFYIFFRNKAFIKDQNGDCLLDKFYEQSIVYSKELGDELEENIYDAIQILAQGFLDHKENNLKPIRETIEEIYENSLIFLYRVIFILYAESRGLIDTENRLYSDDYGLVTLKRDIADKIGSNKYTDWQTKIWDRLEKLFDLIDRGSEEKGIPSDQLYIPPYNGGLFDQEKHRFLEENMVPDSYLSKVIDLLCRSESESENGEKKVFVDYSSLEVRHLGGIYEGLLEHNLNYADQEMVAAGKKGNEKWKPKKETEDNSNIVDRAKKGSVYLSTDKGERKATGSYYTPQYIVEYIVENTLDPIVEDLKDKSLTKEDPAEWFASKIFELDILDPAMGSGHFLVEATDYLASEIVRARAVEGESDQKHDIHWARREVARRCIYGVDINPLATELAKLSLWLETMSKGKPLTYLDHHLKTGNSLIGADMEEIETLPQTEKEEKPDQSLFDLDEDFQEARDKLVSMYKKLESVPDNSLENVRLKEGQHEELNKYPLRVRFEELANVHLSTYFDNEVPKKSYQKLKNNIRNDEEWAKFRNKDWFKKAQKTAKEKNFFHWKLEYPEGFFNSKSGFDAVIGNPPWAIETNESVKKYLWEKYKYQLNKPDLYRFFIERCISLTNRKYSMITPNTWFVMGAAKPLRHYILKNNYLSKASIVPNDAFNDVSANMITFQIDIQNKSDEISVWNLQETGKTKYLRSIDYDDIKSNPPYKIELRFGSKQRKIANKMAKNAVNLSKIADLTTGYQLYHTSIHSEDEIENEVFHSDEKKNKDYIPEVRGGSLSKYFVDPEPDGFIDSTADFYRIPEKRFLKNDKVLIREVTGSKGIIASHTDRKLFFPKSIISIVINNKKEFSTPYLSGLLNSTAMSFYFLITGEKSSQDLFPRLSISSLKTLPIISGNKKISRSLISKNFNDNQVFSKVSNKINNLSSDKIKISKLIEILVNLISKLKKESKKYNISLEDYLGSFSEGQTIEDIYIPVEDLSDTIINDTTEVKNNLRIGSIKFEEKQNNFVLMASARYKPENPEKFETDRWGYTETDFIPAMKFDVDEKMEVLIREFVPLAVDEGGGFAGFRENATKTISPLDRLENITLPKLSDVEDGLKKYLENKEKAEELEKEIQEIDNEIDALVFDLYDLTRDKVVTVLDSLDTPSEEKEDILSKFDQLVDED